jgi:2-methylcitrate dehydratase PrpD
MLICRLHTDGMVVVPSGLVMVCIEPALLLACFSHHLVHTSVAGALAAALVACDLSRVDDTRKGDGLGIALSQASGVFEFLTNGSTVKSLHAGWAAHGGIVAGTMAGAGLTGPETAFEGQFGLFRRFAVDPGAADRFAAEIATFGVEWHLPQAAFKFYPCCHYIHPFIEALEIALGQNPAETVEAIVCEVPPGGVIAISNLTTTGSGRRGSLGEV